MAATNPQARGPRADDLEAWSAALERRDRLLRAREAELQGRASALRLWWALRLLSSATVEFVLAVALIVAAVVVPVAALPYVTGGAGAVIGLIAVGRLLDSGFGAG